MKVRLNKEEFTYVVSAEFVPENIRTEIANGVRARSVEKAGRERVVVELAEETADTVRSLCEDQLTFAGFNTDYSLNSEGRILDSLIDKFFTG